MSCATPSVAWTTPGAGLGSGRLTPVAPCAAATCLKMTAFLFSGVEQLHQEMQGFQRRSYAPNSQTTRGVQVRKYLEFVEDFSVSYSPLPCPPQQVALYATWLARTLKYSSVLNYLSGLNHFLRQNGATPIPYTDYEIATTLRGIRRERACPPRQALPILPDMLVRMFALLSSNQGHVAWRAAVLCSFRALLRKCQVTRSDSSLQRGDFQFFTWGMVIRVRRSKTIQFQERVLEIPVARCHATAICAVHWTERHFRETPAAQEAMAFRIPTATAGESAPLPYLVYQDTLKAFAGRAGLDPSSVSSHSLRRGGCTYLSMCGASLEELRVRGDWASDTVFTYLKTPLAVRIINDMRVAAALSSSPSSSAGQLAE